MRVGAKALLKSTHAPLPLNQVMEVYVIHLN